MGVQSGHSLQKNLDLVITLQNKCIRIINVAPFNSHRIINVAPFNSHRIINVAPFNSHANDLFISNEFLKFGEIIIIEQMY